MPIELVKKPLGWKDGPITTGKFVTPSWFLVDSFFLFNMTGRHLGGKVFKGLVKEELRLDLREIQSVDSFVSSSI